MLNAYEWEAFWIPDISIVDSAENDPVNRQLVHPRGWQAKEQTNMQRI